MTFKKADPKAEVKDEATPDPKFAELFAEIERLKAVMRRNGWTL